MQLVVSVRSVEEARLALAGGAALIDVKDPARGSLGRADEAELRAIVSEVGSRVPVSAAMGEWRDDDHRVPQLDLTFIKWGLAGCRRRSAWRMEHRRLMDLSRRPQVVLAAYADSECAQAPPVDDVFALACAHPGSVMLIDTHCKDAGVGKRRPTLLDWMPVAEIEELCARAREADVRIALAGSLGVDEITALLPARPHWFAVRGAVCDHSDRRSALRPDKVQALVEMLSLAQVDDTHAQVG